MDLDVMLEKCRREQWRVGDLDWSGTPREMSREDEIAVVQYFTDMAGIERLAGALFREQQLKCEDSVLREIFGTFVKDEVRHSHAAQMLADYYDVHEYRSYEVNPALRKFTPHFIAAIKSFSPEIANAYVTGGELILDIALLRSIDDHVADDMSARAMKLINRDESRHIAIDFHMVERYCSPEYADSRRHMPPKALLERARGWWALVNVLVYGAPFFRDVFFRSMKIVDPRGRRLREAFKRMQLLGAKPTVARQPFTRFVTTLQEMYRRPLLRLAFGRTIERVLGVEGEFIDRLYSEDEWRRASRASFDELADEALSAKYAS